ncbi:type VII secretion-associated serine protease mycosin [Mycobacterium sp. 852002-51152_SCH6134967]|uniref:type VII secretion-associated serine protease mycosin n=1 Tax=Mycobacterium sp. 852002-51152_SCH6134967 TaxID=1834096 RepID=UPI000801469D|nr:type VII secretion-associated serine protease mycosin [Mycobacterium sp. 852002-51152_SCH6134967]OBF89212.1 type VII secretion-associated serine protease mycosin [Mycobacterium sp. 852002-51152_SCH6134967]
MRDRLRTVVAATAAMAVVAVSSPVAQALTPPQVDPAVPPPSGAAGPVQLQSQRGPCVGAGVLPGSDPGAPSTNQKRLNLEGAWEYSRGDGQLVAVIDTGVTPGPRLPNVEPGGDFVESTDGLSDCDGHGTLVAGLIAGQPGADGFSGVAPGARVLAIRSTSSRFSPREIGENPATAQVALDVATLARAVVRAADLGARVINISAVTCLPATENIDQNELGAALRYAAVDKDAVIVAAAGNTKMGLNPGSACPSNPLSDPSRPEDPRNWAGVTSVSIPSSWQPYVLSVGSLDSAGRPSDFTMAGPWVGIAAPGQDIVSVGNGEGGALANGLPDERGRLYPLNGTSFAAAYVSGVAALVRSRFPELTAEQVRDRLTAGAQGAARAPSNLTGAGLVDPVAALTWDVTAVVAGNGEPEPQPVAAPPRPAAPDETPKVVAFVGTGVLALIAAVTAAVAVRRRRNLDNQAEAS